MRHEPLEQMVREVRLRSSGKNRESTAPRVRLRGVSDRHENLPVTRRSLGTQSINPPTHLVGVTLPAPAAFGMCLFNHWHLLKRKVDTPGGIKYGKRPGVTFGDPPGTLRVPGPPDDFWPEVKQKNNCQQTGGRRLVFGQRLRVLVCSGTGPESSTGSPDLLVQAALAARAKLLYLSPNV